MDFRSLNKFNVIVNTASGNFLPLTSEKTDLGFFNWLYFIFVWSIDTTYVILTLGGSLYYLPVLEAVRTGGISMGVALEVFFFAAYLMYRREYLHNFIHKINSILVDSDDLRRCIHNSIEPHTRGLKLYTFLNLGSWLIWEAWPLGKILEMDQFTYTDFRITTYFPGGPFTVNGFVLGTVFRIIGGCYIMLKKVSIDVYITYFITLLTAEYRYLEERVAAALREKDETLVIRALKECVIDHCNTMKTGEILINILSFNIGVAYFNCIFRFCFTGFTVITLPGAYMIKFLTVIFGIGSLMQVYLLCSCIQDLLEASTSVPNQAFYADWYEHGQTVKSIYRTIGMGNRIECRLNAFRIFDLTVPTVATILKQAYSACLLLMNVQ